MKKLLCKKVSLLLLVMGIITGTGIAMEEEQKKKVVIIEEALNNEDSNVRAKALNLYEALVESGQVDHYQAALNAAERGLNDQDPDVHDAAMKLKNTLKKGGG